MTPTQTATAPAPRPLADGRWRVGTTHLIVSDLDRSVAYYETAIGLALHRREAGLAALGAGGEDLLVLHEEPGARRAGRHAGLYHVALLHPSRLDLARAAHRLAVTRTPIQGASDHGISEAIYLADPDGNGLELAADRPRESWPDLRTLGMPDPLDLHALLRLVADEGPPGPVDPGLIVGHVHLHVSDLDAAIGFYRDLLGLEIQTSVPSAAFLSADGYHHHVAVNTWRGDGVPGAPATGVAGLRHWTLVLTAPDRDALRTRATEAGVPVEEVEGGLLLRGPSGIAVLLATAGGEATP
jgi:catechol 2,3-dioxygenase